MSTSLLTAEKPVAGTVERPEPTSSPRLFYGWIMLPVAMLGLIATSPGQTYGVSVFIEPMRVGLGLTHSQIAWAYTLGSLLGAVPIMAFGALMDRFGLKTMLLCGTVLFTGACLLTATAGGFLSLFLSFLLLRMLGPGVIALLCGNTLSFWFHRRLGTVEGIRQVGMACAMAMIPAGYYLLNESLGWRGSYVAMGLGVSAVLIPVVLLLFRNSPAEVGQRVDGELAPVAGTEEVPKKDERYSFTVQQAMRTRAYWLVGLGTGMFAMIQTGIFFAITAIAEERGLDALAGVGFLARFALSLAALQLIGGILADRMEARGLMSTAIAMMAAATAMLWRAETASALLWSGILMGAAQGLFFSASNPIWARYFGLQSLGKIRGSLMTMMVASSSLGPLLIGNGREITGSYGPVLAGFAVIPLLMSLPMLAVRKPAVPAGQG